LQEQAIYGPFFLDSDRVVNCIATRIHLSSHLENSLKAQHVVSVVEFSHFVVVGQVVFFNKFLKKSIINIVNLQLNTGIGFCGR
jgi:hypothetical protein